MSTAMPDLDQKVEENIDQQPDTPWKVVLWNDDVNATEYVTLVLQKVLKKDRNACEALMLEAHSFGKVAVFSGSQEEATQKATQLGSASLWATLEKE